MRSHKLLLPLVAVLVWGCRSETTTPTTSAPAPKTETTQTPTPGTPETKPAEETPKPVSEPLKFTHAGADYYGLTSKSDVALTMTQSGQAPVEGTFVIKLGAVKGDSQEATVERTGGLAILENESVQVDKDGVWVLGTGGGTFDHKVMELPADAAPGKTWSQKAKLDNGGAAAEMDIQVKAVAEETIKTVRGDLKTLKVTNDGTMKQGDKTMKVSGVTWYAKGIGMVKATMSVDGKNSFSFALAK